MSWKPSYNTAKESKPKSSYPLQRKLKEDSSSVNVGVSQGSNQGKRVLSKEEIISTGIDH